MAKSEFENLRVYQLAEELADKVWNIASKWSWFAKTTVGQQLARAADSMGANIAEGNGKSSEKDRSRFFEIARGSALECAAIQDVLEIGEVLSVEENQKAKQMLLRIVSMLTKLAQRGYFVGEEQAEYKTDYDSDYDGDCEELT